LPNVIAHAPCFKPLGRFDEDAAVAATKIEDALVRANRGQLELGPD
jgi:hypothetical protein